MNYQHQCNREICIQPRQWQTPAHIGQLIRIRCDSRFTLCKSVSCWQWRWVILIDAPRLLCVSSLAWAQIPTEGFMEPRGWYMTKLCGWGTAGLNSYLSFPLTSKREENFSSFTTVKCWLLSRPQINRGNRQEKCHTNGFAALLIMRLFGIQGIFFFEIFEIKVVASWQRERVTEERECMCVCVYACECV